MAIETPLELPRLATTEQAADYLGLKPQTLEAWRTNRRYDLPYVKVGRRIMYRREHLMTWLEQRTVGTTTQGA